MTDMLGVYVHIPFCLSKCLYCDFNSYPAMLDMAGRYADTLVREAEASPYRGRTADTLYIGGGTPTCIETGDLIRITEAVRAAFNINGEITAECNPGTADYKKLRAMRRAGINRLSIGCQSTHDSLLHTLGRIHSYACFEECFKDARRAGFDNISVDLMFGLPGQSLKMWLDTINKIIDIRPEHISAYALKLEEGTPFYDMRSKLSLPDDDLSRDMYDAAVELMAKNGYARYEISNFALENRESQHNLIYWLRGDYIGLGAGACSCIGRKRFTNHRAPDEYINAVSSRTAEDSAQTLICSKADMMSEFAFLALRLDRGIDKAEFRRRFGKDIYEVFGGALGKHMNKTLTDSGDFIRIKPEYTYVSNAIMADFI